MSRRTSFEENQETAYIRTKLIRKSTMRAGERGQGVSKRKRSFDESIQEDVSAMLPLKFVRISSESGGCSDQADVLLNKFPRIDKDGNLTGSVDYAQVNAVLRELAMQRELRLKYIPTLRGTPTSPPHSDVTDDSYASNDMDCSGT